MEAFIIDFLKRIFHSFVSEDLSFCLVLQTFLFLRLYINLESGLLFLHFKSRASSSFFEPSSLSISQIKFLCLGELSLFTIWQSYEIFVYVAVSLEFPWIWLLSLFLCWLRLHWKSFECKEVCFLFLLFPWIPIFLQPLTSHSSLKHGTFIDFHSQKLLYSQQNPTEGSYLYKRREVGV